MQYFLFLLVSLKPFETASFDGIGIFCDREWLEIKKKYVIL